MQSEFGKFDHHLVSIEYPIDWVNVTRRRTRFRPLPLLAYCHRIKRKGLLGAITDFLSWRLDAEFGVFVLPLKKVREKMRSKPESDSDEIVFEYILNTFGLSATKVDVVGKQKEDLGGRRLYHLTVNASGCQSEFRLVAASRDVGVILKHTAPLEALDDFRQTFERIVQSFKVKH